MIFLELQSTPEGHEDGLPRNEARLLSRHRSVLFARFGNGRISELIATVPLGPVPC